MGKGKVPSPTPEEYAAQAKRGEMVFGTVLGVLYLLAGAGLALYGALASDDSVTMVIGGAMAGWGGGQVFTVLARRYHQRRYRCVRIAPEARPQGDGAEMRDEQGGRPE